MNHLNVEMIPFYLVGHIIYLEQSRPRKKKKYIFEKIDIYFPSKNVLEKQSHDPNLHKKITIILGLCCAGENRQTRFNQQQVGTIQGKYQFLSKRPAEEQKFQFLCFAYRYSNRFRLVNTLPGRVSMAFEDKSL